MKLTEHKTPEGTVWANEQPIQEGKSAWVINGGGNVSLIDMALLTTIKYVVIAQSPEMNLPGVAYYNPDAEIEKLAKEYGLQLFMVSGILAKGFMDGYKAAQNQFSEEDMKKAFSAGAASHYNDNHLWDEYRASLSQLDWDGTTYIGEDERTYINVKK